MPIVAELDGEHRVISALQGLLFDGDELAKFGRRAGAAMVDSTHENFANQAAPDGTPWKPSQRAIVQSGETLRDTGRLLNSITWNLLPDGVEWGTNVFYAPVLHYGARIRAKNAEYLRFRSAYGWVKVKEVTITPRPFFGIKHEDELTLIDIIGDITSEGFNAY